MKQEKGINSRVSKVEDELNIKKVEHVVTQSTLVNTIIELAENLNWYVWGSRRFGMESKDSDVDIFFTQEKDYECFCNHLTHVWTKDERYMPMYNNINERGHRYARVKSRYSNVQNKSIEKQWWKQIVVQLKSKYTVDDMPIDVSCVDALLTLKEEVLIYAKRKSENQINELSQEDTNKEPINRELIKLCTEGLY